MSNKNLKKTYEAFNKSNPVTVSVIVDTYNHKDYISENLESILNQLVDFNIEILIHDDCSTDGTQYILQEYEKKYPSIIKVIYETENQFSKNIDVDFAFNYPRISGKYVAMCEGDDKWIDNYKLYKQVKYLDSHEKISAYIAKTIRFNMRDNVYGYYGLAVDKCSKNYSLKDLIKGKDFSVSSFLARREFFVPPFPQFLTFFAGFSDIQLGFYFALKSKIFYDSHPLSMYRQYSSPHSFTASFSHLEKEKKIETYKNRIRILQLLLDVIPKKYRKILLKRIKQEKFGVLVIENDTASLMSKEFKRMYKRKLFHEKIKRLLNMK